MCPFMTRLLRACLRGGTPCHLDYQEVRSRRLRTRGGRMKEGTANAHAATVREFLHIVTAQAKAALTSVERPGLLQLSRLHPSSETLVPSRFMLGDIEHLT